MMRFFDVVIVGAGPAGAAAAISTSQRVDPDTVLLVSGPAAARNHPVVLGSRALSELAGLNYGIEAGRLLSQVTVGTPDVRTAIELEDRALVLGGVAWGQELTAMIQSSGVHLFDGNAEIVDPFVGSVVLRRRSNSTPAMIRARTVIWATGEDPIGRKNYSSAIISISRSKRTSSPPLEDHSELRLTIPYVKSDRRLAATSSSWEFDHEAVHYIGTLTEVDGNVHMPSGGETAVASDLELLASEKVSRSYSADGSAVGRVLLVGNAAGLSHLITGEGISYAFASGKLAGVSAACQGDVLSEYVNRLKARFGESSALDSSDMRRTRLAVNSIRDSVQKRSPARDRIVGIMLDRGVTLPGTSQSSADSTSPSWTYPQEISRARISAITAKEAWSLWRNSAPSLFALPHLPDVRLSDLLVASASGHGPSAKMAEAGAAIDLIAASIGFLAASISNQQTPTQASDWTEITSVISHDILASRALVHAVRSGPASAAAFVGWVSTLIHVRKEVVDGKRGPVELFETAFEFPGRVASLFSSAGADSAQLLTSACALVGRCFALGEELRFIDGRNGRLGLTSERAQSHRLRWRISAEDDLAVVAAERQGLVTCFESRLEQLSHFVPESGIAALRDIFITAMGESSDVARQSV